jgi:hypothetical protein
MTCKDSSITYLKNAGYNVVRVPKADILPLQILINEKGIMKPLGELSTILKSPTNLPAIKMNTPLASISGTKTSDLSLGVGISILGNIIGAMGGTKLGLDAKYEKARTISFEFEDVLEDSVSIALLDQYLGEADVDPRSRYVAELLEADEIYVTTATIKSQKFSIDGKQKNNASVTVEVPEIQEIVGGNVKVSGKGKKTSKISFEGTIPLVFGFQAVRLVYENGRYQTFRHLEAGKAAASTKKRARQLLTTPATFINLSFN